MKVEDTQNDDVRKLGELVKDIRVAMLTTQTPDGRLVSRPLSTLEIAFDGDLWFFTAADSGKVDEMLQHPQVNLAYAEPKTQTYISISGTGQLLRDRAKIDELWSPVSSIYFPKGKDDPELVLLKVHVVTAEYWESSSNFIGRAFQFAKAMVTKDVSDLGENRRLDVGG